jgi:hypothetical protein
LASGDIVPFTASLDDPEPHGRAIYAALIDSGNIAPFTPPDWVPKRAPSPNGVVELA